MYDAINEIAEDTPVPLKDFRRLWMAFAVLAALTLLVGAALFSNRGEPEQVIDVEALAAQQAAYLTATAEASPAMRRARLTDFLNTYPSNERRGEARAQLQVIAQAEAEDWAALSHIIFDTDIPTEEKRAAFNQYEADWDPSLLGGREDDVARIRRGLTLEETPLPDRDLPIDPESIPKNVPGDVLLGGVARARRGYAPPRQMPWSGQDVNPETSQEAVVPPRIQRNRRPKYPRRALERGAEAEIVLDLYISAKGRVESTAVISAEADAYERDFIRAAERAAKRMRYYPKTVNGRPVPASHVEKSYIFRMRN